MNKITMPKGEYFIGDLCYILDDRWDEFCDLTISGEKCLDGSFSFNDGIKFASFRTAYGDGVYCDQHGNEYCVDAGLIGCIKISSIECSSLEELQGLGSIISFEEDFECSAVNGNLYFGNIHIDTTFEDEDEDEDGDEDGEGIN